MKAPLTAVIALLVLVSCQTSQPPIPLDASAEIYFQRAQAASDLSQYNEALAIYRSFLDNRPDASRESVFSARYEVAFLQLKKGQAAEAQAGFEGILADFTDLDKSAGAPAWVNVLSQKILQRIKEQAPKATK